MKGASAHNFDMVDLVTSDLFQKTLLQCIAAPLLCRLRLGYLCVEPGMHFSGAQWLQCEFHILIRCYKLYKARTLMCLESWCHDPWSIYDPYYLQFLVIQLLLFTCGSSGFTQRCFSSCRQPLRRLPIQIANQHNGRPVPSIFNFAPVLHVRKFWKTCFFRLQVGSVPFLQLKTNQILEILDLAGWPPSCSD